MLMEAKTLIGMKKVINGYISNYTEIFSLYSLSRKDIRYSERAFNIILSFILMKEGNMNKESSIAYHHRSIMNEILKPHSRNSRELQMDYNVS